MSGYAVEFEQPVISYMRAVDRMTEVALDAITDGMRDELSRDADKFLRLFPVARESYTFRYDFAHQDGPAACQFNFEFACDGSAMPYGVVRVILVIDCEVIPFADPPGS